MGNRDQNAKKSVIQVGTGRNNSNTEYYEKNKEQRKQKYQENKEKRKENYDKGKRKEDYEKNKEKNKDKRKEYYQNNKEKSREYYQKNKEVILEKVRKKVTNLSLTDSLEIFRNGVPFTLASVVIEIVTELG
jgi:F0F1-type ATP synthase membrane subunit b/b'